MDGSTGAKTGVVALILALLPSILSAAVVRISWNANTESDLEGYRVFYGTSHGRYGSAINVGRRTTIDVSGLAAGMTYYFAVTAYDYSGNESGYSAEQSVTIPSGGASDGSGSGEDTGLVDEIDDIVEWLEQVVRNIFGLDPEVPVYALGDFGTLDPETTVNPSGSVMSKEFTGRSASEHAALCDLYPVRDAILERGFAFDLSSIYPDGAYLFYPLDTCCPDIDDQIVVPGYAGSFFYVVFGESGSVDHLLHLSVAEEIYEIRSYVPGSAQLIEDITTGLAIDLPAGATEGTKPIAIGWGGFEAFPGASVLPSGIYDYYFDILPYGLELECPALVSMPFAGERAGVERYDAARGEWVPIVDVLVAGGYLSFSSQTLGRFRVTAIQDDAGSVTEDAPYEGSDRSCFMEASGSGDPRAPWASIVAGAVLVAGVILQRIRHSIYTR